MNRRQVIVTIQYAFDDEDEAQYHAYLDAGLAPRLAIERVVQDAVGFTGAHVTG